MHASISKMFTLQVKIRNFPSAFGIYANILAEVDLT